MFSLKKVSSFVFSIIIFSLALNALAQTIPENIKPLTASELAGLNNLPSVEVTQLVLDKVEYKSGDTVKGTFFIQNDRAYTMPDLKYKVSLAGKYGTDGLAGIYYDNQTFGPIFLEASGKKQVDFLYVLPKTVAGNNLGIQVQAFTSSGSPLAWTDAFIKVVGTMSFLDISDAYVEISGQKFSLQAGPGLNAERTGSMNVKLQNNSTKEVVVTSEIKIYNRTVTGELLKTTKLEAVAIPAKTSKIIKSDLDNLDNTAGVYEAIISFTDGTGVKTAPSLQYRYIVLGEAATIQYVSVDKYSVKKGEDFNLTIGYTGTPYDLMTGQVPTSTPLNIKVSLTNETGRIVADYEGKLDFNKGTSMILPLTAKTNANKLSLAISVADDLGKVITTFNNVITGEIKEEVGRETETWVYIVTTLAILSIIILLLIQYRKKKIIITLMVVSFLLFSSFLVSETAKANSIVWEDSAGWVTVTALNSPSNVLAPGQTFRVTGAIETRACSNTPGDVTGLWSDIKPAGDSFNYAVLGNYPYTGTITNTASYDPDNHNIIYYQNSFSLSRNGLDFIAPTTPGLYRIYIKVVLPNFLGSGINTFSWGYVEFRVIAPPVFSVSCSAQGTMGTVSWNPGVIGADRYEMAVSKTDGSSQCNYSFVNGVGTRTSISGAGCGAGSGSWDNFTFTTLPGQTYKAWGFAYTGNYNSAQGDSSSFNCPIPPITSACTGSIPSGSTKCANTNETTAVAWSSIPSCGLNTPHNCRYTTPPASGSNCTGQIPDGSAKCTGTIETVTTPWVSVSSCPATPGNCQYRTICVGSDCDNGNGNNPDPSGICGNGLKAPSEACDRGSLNGSCPAECSTSCTFNNCPIIPPAPALDCSLISINNPSNNAGQVLINTGTNWSVTATAPLNLSGYTKTWTLTDDNNITPALIGTGDSITKYFTTTGEKKIFVTVASTTPTIKCDIGPSITRVVQQSDIIEI